MKLPCGTLQHERAEEARAMHERIYAAFLENQRLLIPVTRDWPALSGALHRFWNCRGFSLHGKTEGSMIHVWITRSTRYEKTEIAS